MAESDHNKKLSDVPKKSPRGRSQSVREYILATFSKGDWLPPETELASRLEITRYAVSKALNEMHTHGLLQREPGRGTLVAWLPEVTSPEPRRVAQTVVFICSELS